jgi:ectoine hydroxylase-related dioxygenase (phytanoyl-CoA dioxygenase family)
MSGTAPPASAATGLRDSDIARYRERGYVVVENAVDRRDLDAALDSLRALQARGAVSQNDRYNAAGRVDFRKIPNLAKSNEAFRRLACAPAVVSAIEALIGQEALLFRDVMVVKPARDGAHLDYHQDSEYWDIEPRALVSAWFTFRDVGVADGCLRVIDGSHLRRYTHDILIREDRPLPSWITAGLRRLVSLSGTGDSDASGFSAARSVKNAVLGRFTRHAGFLAKLQDLHARIPEDEKRRAVDLPVRAGSVVLFHSMLLHASNTNTSDLERPAYIPSYMGAEYRFCGVGTPEFLVVRERDRQVFKKIRVAKS